MDTPCHLMMIGQDIYAHYGLRRSHLEPNMARRKGETIMNALGIVLSLMCVVTGFWHQQTVGWNESKLLLIFSCLFALVHFVYYILRIWRHHA